jgi:hypothetical protein
MLNFEVFMSRNFSNGFFIYSVAELPGKSFNENASGLSVFVGDLGI